MRRLIAIATVGVLLCACTREQSHNLSDETFVRSMIPHHELGISLIEEATLHSDDVRLRRLVFEMGTYHHSELDLLHRFGQDWDVRPFLVFPGFINKNEISRLSTARGVKHDIQWVQLMILHHRGAIEIAQRQIQEGQEKSLHEVARRVISQQSLEITEMEELLRDLLHDQHGVSISEGESCQTSNCVVAIKSIRPS